MVSSSLSFLKKAEIESFFSYASAFHFMKVDDEILRSLVSSLCFTNFGVWTPSAIHMTLYFNTLAALWHPPPCHGVGIKPLFCIGTFHNSTGIDILSVFCLKL